jgi:hypothetical protein
VPTPLPSRTRTNLHTAHPAVTANLSPTAPVARLSPAQDEFIGGCVVALPLPAEQDDSPTWGTSQVCACPCVRAAGVLSCRR